MMCTVSCHCLMCTVSTAYFRWRTTAEMYFCWTCDATEW